MVDFISVMLWFTMQLILLILAYVAYQKLPKLVTIVVLAFALVVAVPAINAFEGYATIPALIMFLTVTINLVAVMKR